MDTGKQQCSTLSERRGLGLMTLNQRYCDSARWERKDEGATGETTGPANGAVIRSGAGASTGSSGGQGIRQSVLQKVSYFRWRQLQDGGGVGDVASVAGAVTVEEISRDCPASSQSPGSSPGSKNRAWLPGLSPRWPHTYHHESIFNFPSLSSSLARRRPSADVALSRIAGARSAGSSSRSRHLRLPTVAEKPVAAATETEAATRASCGVSDQSLTHKSLPVERRADVGSADGLSSRPSQAPRVFSCVCNSTADQCYCALSASELQSSTASNIHHVQAQAKAEECRDRNRPVSPGLPRAWRTAAANWQCPYSDSPTESSPGCLLGFPSAAEDATSPSHTTPLNAKCVHALRIDECDHHRRCYSNRCALKNRSGPQDHSGAAGDDHHRGSSHCPTTASCYVLTDTPHPSPGGDSSVGCEDGGAHSTDPQPSSNIHECSVPERRAECTSKDCPTCYWCSGQVTQPVTRLEHCEVVAMNRDADVPSTDPLTGLMELEAQDKNRAPFAPPTDKRTTSSRQCADARDGVLVDGPVVTAPPITLVLAAPRPPLGAQWCHASCRQHEAANKMGNCSSCHGGVAWNTQPSGTSSASPLAPKSVHSVSQPLSSAGPSVGARRTLVHQKSESGAFPSSRSSGDADPAGRNFTASDGRDRRALSVDRSVSAAESESKMPVTSFKARAAHKSSKVEKLRELTERLRPSSSSSWPSTSSSAPSTSVSTAVESSSSCRTAAVESDPVQSAPVAAFQLPPIPVAPPRHPRGRFDRKKLPRVKKDSATSTADLGALEQAATETTPPATATEKANENGDIVRKKTCLASSAEVTRQPSLFLPPPANDDQQQQQLGQERGRDGLFSANPLVATPPLPPASPGQTETPSARSEDVDLFEDVQLTVSKLNPKILVGTYQQRTIPFRSASFSQIDVGTDGTYNRRPRTPITLKPITYSIGKDSPSPSPSPLSATLPRRKTSERQESKSPVHGSVNPSVFHLSETLSPASAPHQPGVNPDEDQDVPVRPDRHVHQVESSKVADVEAQTANIQEDLEHGSQSPLMSPEPKDWVGLVRPNLSAESRPASSESEETEATGTAIIKKESGPCSEAIDMSDYESTEISVRADIRLLSPDRVDESEPLSPDANTTSRRMTIHESKSSLDLVELNNHFLRLSATETGSESPSKSESGIIIKQESSDHSDGDAPSKCGTAERSSPTWLTQLFRIANGQRESNSSLSDEGCVTDPAEYAQPEINKKVPFSEAAEHPSFSQQVTPEPSPPSPPPRPLERMNSKRRRRTCALAGGSSAAAELAVKVNPRPLSHPLQSSMLIRSPTVEEESSAELTSGKSCSLSAADALEGSLNCSQRLDETISSSDTLVDALDSTTDHVHTSAASGDSGQVPSGDQSQLTSIRVENTESAYPPSDVMEDAAKSETEEPAADEGAVPTTNQPARSRLMVSLSLTLSSSPYTGHPSPAPVTSPSHSPRNASPQPPASIQEMHEGCSEKSPQPKSPQAPRRYGTLKRRPLRGPYGEMLEAEMNKSEISKMYHTKRSEDLSFLREPCPRSRDVKSSSPRPHSPAGLASMNDECIRSAASTKECNARQNSLPLPLPTCHSLDDSRLKVGYNTLPFSISNSSSGSGGSNSASRLLNAKRKISANLPYVFSDGDLGNQKSEKNLRDESAAAKSDGGKTVTVAHSKATSPISSIASHGTAHQRTSSSPCQLMFTEGGFTSEDEPELLELTSLSRSTAKLLEPEAETGNAASVSADRTRATVARSGSVKRHRVSLIIRISIFSIRET